MTRAKNDYYPTPAWCVHRLLDYLHKHQILNLFPTVKGEIWYEPCAGEGSIIKAADHWLLKNGQDLPVWYANDIDEMHRAALSKLVEPEGATIGDCVDNIAFETGACDVIITNPPFCQAQDIIEFHSDWGAASHAFYLLRLNFLASKERHDFFTESLCEVFRLPNRPSFTSDGHTDMQEYAWFYFGDALRTEMYGQIHFLDLTPLEVRRADRISA
ncbi:MAG: hypothetical protein ACTSYX_08045 [Candidatus Thorarchaeota archaeon]